MPAQRLNGLGSRKPNCHTGLIRFCREGSVIIPQGIIFAIYLKKIVISSIRLTKKGGTAEVSLLPLQGKEAFFLSEVYNIQAIPLAPLPGAGVGY